MNRIHPQDLRAIMAAIVTSHPEGPGVAHAVAFADNILAELERTAKPAPCCERDHDGDGNCDRHREPKPGEIDNHLLGEALDAMKARAEAAEAQLEKYRKLGEPRDVAQLAYFYSILQEVAGEIPECVVLDHAPRLVREMNCRVADLKARTEGAESALAQAEQNIQHERERAEKAEARENELEDLRDFVGHMIGCPKDQIITHFGRLKEELSRANDEVKRLSTQLNRDEETITVQAKQLVAIDAAKAKEPPMPDMWTAQGEPQPGALANWGRQGWNTAAALRVDVAKLKEMLADADVRLAEAHRGDSSRLSGLVEELLGQIDVPERNCSCHISPPCRDCVEFAGLRESVAAVRAALERK